MRIYFSNEQKHTNTVVAFCYYLIFIFPYFFKKRSKFLFLLLFYLQISFNKVNTHRACASCKYTWDINIPFICELINFFSDLISHLLLLLILFLILLVCFSLLLLLIWIILGIGIINVGRTISKIESFSSCCLCVLMSWLEPIQIESNKKINKRWLMEK